MELTIWFVEKGSENPESRIIEWIIRRTIVLYIEQMFP
jgi:hypothetical protein